MDNGIAMVTGGGRGIGRAIAERLAADGYTVVVVGRTAATLAAVAKSVGGHAIVCDMSDPAATAACLDEVRRTVGRVDVLVCNAGITNTEPLHRTTDEAFERLWQVNCRAPFQLTRALLPEMIDAEFGRVVLVASVAGLTGFPYASAYCASKHALVGMMRSVAKEIAAKQGVTINAVCPGWVRTDMAKDVVSRVIAKTGRTEAAAISDLAKMSPQNRLFTPEEVAHVVAMLCSVDARGIHGECITLDGGQLTG